MISTWKYKTDHFMWMHWIKVMVHHKIVQPQLVKLVQYVSWFIKKYVSWFIKKYVSWFIIKLAKSWFIIQYC